MANPFYTYSGAFIPGTLARAEAVATEYQLVQVGFALLAVQGTDSGSANTYVVATNSGRTAYADGNIVEFKAAASNTGSCTINVDGIGAVGLKSSGGQNLGAGAIIASTWYRVIYNTTYSAFTLIAPSSTIISTSTVASAAPTNKVGLVAAGGVSLSVVPIDATYALDQSIVPTWTGAHTFASTVAFNSTVTFSGGLSLTGAADQYAATLTGNSGAGHSKGVLINAGANSSDVALLINSQSGATEFLRVNGVGGVTIGTPSGGAQGVGTINAVNLYVNGAAVLTTAASGANPTGTVGLTVVNGSAATFMRSDAAPPLSQAITPTWTGLHIWSGLGESLRLAGAAPFLSFYNAAQNTRTGYLQVNAGAAMNLIAENGAVLNLGTNGTTVFTIGTGGGVQLGAPTGGDKGASTLNVAGNLYVNGVAVTSAANITSGTLAAARIDVTAAYTWTGLHTHSPASGASIVLNDTANGTGFQMVGASGHGTGILFTDGNAGAQAWIAGVASATAKHFQIYDNTNAVLMLDITPSAAAASRQIQGYGPTANGLVDMTPDSGSWTSTLSGGFSSGPSGTLKWRRIGNLVMITADSAISNTSNASTDISCSGLPAAITPTTNRLCGATFTNNGVAGFVGQATVQTGGTILLQLVSVANVQVSANQWAPSGGKGITAGWTISYLI